MGLIESVLTICSTQKPMQEHYRFDSEKAVGRNVTRININLIGLINICYF